MLEPRIGPERPRRRPERLRAPPRHRFPVRSRGRPSARVARGVPHPWSMRSRGRRRSMVQPLERRPAAAG